MKQKYFTPEFYANESDRIKAYRAAINKEQPNAKRLWAGLTNYQYYAETKAVGTIFFEISVTDMGDNLLTALEPAQKLIKHIRI